MMPENVCLCYAMKANPFVVKEIDEIIENMKFVLMENGILPKNGDN